MKERITIRNVEQQIDQCEKLLSVPQNMATWSKIVSVYNALKIKRCQMIGESPIVTHGQTEHIF